MAKKTNTADESPGLLAFVSVWIFFIFVGIFSDASFSRMVCIGFVIALVFGAIFGSLGLDKSNAKEKKALASAEEKLRKLVDKHLTTLARKRLQGLSVDEYGVVDSTRWKKDIQYFYNNVLEPTLTEEEKLAMMQNNVHRVMEKHVEYRARREADKLETMVGFNEDMTPTEYERFYSNQLKDVGWATRVTKASGDQGADVVAERNGKLLVVQCKLYNKPVGNKAVQEVVAAKLYYRAHYSAVVTNAGYTSSARELADMTGVMLLHHTDLVRLDDILDD